MWCDTLDDAESVIEGLVESVLAIQANARFMAEKGYPEDANHDFKDIEICCIHTLRNIGADQNSGLEAYYDKRIAESKA